VEARTAIPADAHPADFVFGPGRHGAWAGEPAAAWYGLLRGHRSRFRYEQFPQRRPSRRPPERQLQGPDDAIGPRLHTGIQVTPESGSPVTLDADYSLRAIGMDERTSHFRVTIGEDPEREQTIEMT
jgi:hypothetical protein